jgi:hypothetical protein
MSSSPSEVRVIQVENHWFNFFRDSDVWPNFIKLSSFSDHYHVREYPPLRMEICKLVEVDVVMLMCKPVAGRRGKDKEGTENRIYSLVRILNCIFFEDS